MSADRLPPILSSIIRVTGHDRRKAEREWIDGRRESDRKQARALRVRRLIDMDELPEVEMEEGYGR